MGKKSTLLAWIALTSPVVFVILWNFFGDTGIAISAFCIGGLIALLSVLEAILRRRALSVPVAAVVLHVAILSAGCWVALMQVRATSTR
jgi:hypothetical protein